jgi:hypothetical protein
MSNWKKALYPNCRFLDTKHFYCNHFNIFVLSDFCYDCDIRKTRTIEECYKICPKKKIPIK